MIEATERGEQVEILGGCIETYRNECGDQVIAIRNYDTNKEVDLSMSQNNVEEVIKLLKRGGWTQNSGAIDHDVD